MSPPLPFLFKNAAVAGFISFSNCLLPPLTHTHSCSRSAPTVAGWNVVTRQHSWKRKSHRPEKEKSTRSLFQLVKAARQSQPPSQFRGPSFPLCCLRGLEHNLSKMCLEFLGGFLLISTLGNPRRTYKFSLTVIISYFDSFIFPGRSL